jgi:hypothetical protein
MHATLEWSAALLTPAARCLLPRLSVLVAPFSAETAVSVSAFPPLTTDAAAAALAELVEHSLVAAAPVAGGGLEHRLLEPVRQFASQLMTPDDLPARTRHLGWCATTTSALLDDVHVDTAALRAELLAVGDDVRAALAWAVAQEAAPESAHDLAAAFAALQFRAGGLRAAVAAGEVAAALAPDAATAAADLSRAAAVAKCRVTGDEALRLELAAAHVAEAAGERQQAARAFASAAQLVGRFAGMFASEPDAAVAAQAGAAARRLSAGDPQVDAALAVADGFLGLDGDARLDVSALRERARATGDVLLESAALDLVTDEVLRRGAVQEAARLAAERVALLGDAGSDPARSLEVKDALHVAVFCALGAGDLAAAADYAAAQGRLPFLHEQRDIADEELLAPAALAGHWATVLRIGARFLGDWTAAGQPSAPGRGLPPAAVALTHGLRGHHDEQARWLRVHAKVRRMPVEEASAGSGYGVLFDALVRLHEDHPGAAYALLTAAPNAQAGMHFSTFRQWLSAVTAEAAVLAGAGDADARVREAGETCAGNPVAGAIARRAAALAAYDRRELAAVADEFDGIGAPYQRWRTAWLTGSVDAETAARELRTLDLLEMPEPVRRNR